MPIKYQMLGGSDRLQNLLVTAPPNARVTVSNDQYEKTITTNESGQALFKNLRFGTYNLVVLFSGSTHLSKNVVITDHINESFENLKMIKDVNLRDRLKFSSGKTYVIMNRNLNYHESNTVTLITEFVTEKSEWGSTAGGDAFKTKNQNYYSELEYYEKEKIIYHDYGIGKGYFWTPSLTELELSGSGSKLEGSPIGFVSNGDRKKGDHYWTRTKNDQTMQYHINKDGSRAITSSTNSSIGVVSLCDIKGDTWVQKGQDGYWFIIGQ